MPQLVILAGGLGTRVRHLTGDKPKALITVNGVAFADHQLAWVAAQSVTEVVYCIGHHGDAIRLFAGDGTRWGLDVTYLEDGPRLLGTGGALRQGIELGVIRSPFLVLYGDAFLPISYAPVLRAFQESDVPVLMTVFRNADAWGASNAMYENGMVRLYDKRPEAKEAGMEHIDYGLSVVSADVLVEKIPTGERADLSDVCHELSLEGRLAGYEVAQRFFEVGSPEGLADLEAYLERRTR